LVNKRPVGGIILNDGAGSYGKDASGGNNEIANGGTG